MSDGPHDLEVSFDAYEQLLLKCSCGEQISFNHYTIPARPGQDAHQLGSPIATLDQINQAAKAHLETENA